MRLIAWLPVTAVLMCASFGCSTQTGGYVGAVYYLYGPESALRVAGADEAGAGERALVELERAMALFELGRYEASLAALDSAESALAADLPSDAKPWRPDAHERVLMATLGLVDALALQDGRRAAERADRALERIAAAPCSGCRWAFTRMVAALAYEDVGRFGDGLEVLDGLELDGDGEEMLAAIRDRCRRGIPGREPAGLAPPPVTGRRTMTVLLLLGIGPHRVPERFETGPAATIKWHGYEPYEPQAAESAVLFSGEDQEPASSVVLSDVHELATACLEARTAELETEIARGRSPPARDLRYWLSVPATLQLIEATLPTEVKFLDLLVFAPDGVEIEGESIWIPETWTGGRLFVARRIP